MHNLIYPSFMIIYVVFECIHAEIKAVNLRMIYGDLNCFAENKRYIYRKICGE